MTAERFLEEAQKYLGFRARPGGVSEFGKRVGYAGLNIPWDGAFVDVVAREAGISIPACVHANSGLAEFIYSGRWRNTPRPGDIVFYTFTTGDPFGAPHVGIVTDVSSWKTDGTFLAVEAQVDSGLPRGPKDPDGIYIRRRWKYEVLGFGRPKFKARPARGVKTLTGPKKVKIGQIRPGKRSEGVVLVQNALVLLAGLKNHEPGLFDQLTSSAYARWQRKIGYVGKDASGEPDRPSLERLGRDSRIFIVD